MQGMKVARVLLMLLAYAFSLGSAAQSAPKISELSALDLQYMAQQRDSLQDLARSKLGRQFSGDRKRDLQLLQSLLDTHLVKPKQTREMQAMGIIMGDLLATEYGLHWVIYEDEMGRTRALRYRDSDQFLFPITMISRRREADNRAPVSEIYQRASDLLTLEKPPLLLQ